MAKKSSPDPEDAAKLREDANEAAFRVLQEATGERPKTPPPKERGEDEKNPEAVERGRKGGKRGGKKRAENMTDEQRAEIAQLAARARWKRTKENG